MPRCVSALSCLESLLHRSTVQVTLQVTPKTRGYNPQSITANGTGPSDEVKPAADEPWPKQMVPAPVPGPQPSGASLCHRLYLAHDMCYVQCQRAALLQSTL